MTNDRTSSDRRWCYRVVETPSYDGELTGFAIFEVWHVDGRACAIRGDAIDLRVGTAVGSDGSPEWRRLSKMIAEASVAIGLPTLRQMEILCSGFDWPSQDEQLHDRFADAAE